MRCRTKRGCPIYPEPAAMLLNTAGLVDVLAQEIVEDLEAALAQFREIAGDLGGAVDIEA